jgi:transcriptional regulator with XRE-family HTH domain
MSAKPKPIELPSFSEPFQRLAWAREQAKFATPTDAARRFGWNENTYRSHENGNRDLSRKAAEKYADAFKVPVGWLLFKEGASSKLEPVTSERDRLDRIENILTNILDELRKR